MHIKHIKDNQYDIANSCVAFGGFDGVHIGHRAVVEKLLEVASAKGLTPVLVSFDRDEAGDKQILTSEHEKLYLLRESPIEFFVSLQPQSLGEVFVKKVLVEGFAPRR